MAAGATQLAVGGDIPAEYVLTVLIARDHTLPTRTRNHLREVCSGNDPRADRRAPDGRRRPTARRTRLQTGVAPQVEWLLQLRHLVLDHLDPGRLLHHLRSGVEQRRPGRHLLGLAADLPVHPDHRFLHGRAGVGVPDRGRDLLVGGHHGSPGARLVHRLAEPHRSGGGHRLGGLRLRDVPQPHPVRALRRLGGDAAPGVRPLRDHPGAARADQHLRAPDHRRTPERLGLVARGRRGRRGGHPGLRAGQPPELPVRVHRALQQLRFR